jgi:hypothetical protein
MKHIFPFQRNLLKAVRPIANRVAPFELPPDTYFGNIRDLFEKLEGVDELMEDPQITRVRLVTNPEKMVLRETQRAFVYFSLHQFTRKCGLATWGNGTASAKPATRPSRETTAKRFISPGAAVVWMLTGSSGPLPLQNPGRPEQTSTPR